MQFYIELLLNVAYSLEAIEHLLLRANKLGFSRFTYRSVYDQIPIEVDVAQAANHLMEGHKKDPEQFFQFVVLHAPGREALELWVHDHAGLLSISSNGIPYLHDDYLSVLNDIHVFLQLTEKFRILKCKVTHEFQVDYLFEYTGHLDRPAIGFFGMSFNKQLLLQNILEAGYSYHGSKTNALNEKHSETFALTSEEGNVKVVVESGTIWFFPEKPYRMRQYEQEYAIDTAFYIEKVLELCNGLEISVIETFKFEQPE